MASLYHYCPRKSNINSQENTAEKTFHFRYFFWQTDDIRRIFSWLEKEQSEIMFEILLVG